MLFPGRHKTHSPKSLINCLLFFHTFFLPTLKLATHFYTSKGFCLLSFHLTFLHNNSHLLINYIINVSILCITCLYILKYISLESMG